MRNLLDLLDLGNLVDLIDYLNLVDLVDQKNLILIEFVDHNNLADTSAALSIPSAL